VLWVCRASAGSAILALALFAVAPPARDLFAELASGPLYWAIFLLLVFGWALIVHYAARKALEQQAWAAPGLRLPLRAREREELQDRFAVSGTWVPRLLGLLCFAAVARTAATAAVAMRSQSSPGASAVACPPRRSDVSLAPWMPSANLTNC
jgi:hypothetical protein